MKTEIAAVALVLLVGLGPLVFARRRRRRAILFSALAVVAAVGCALWILPTPDPRAAVHPNRPLAVDGDGYVSSDTCRDCHPQQYAAWHRSYHRTMTQVASPRSVLADFSGSFENDGARYRLSREGQEFWVDMDLPLRERPGQTVSVRKPVVLTTGSHHMQVYWYATERTRELVALPFAFLKEDRLWVPRVSIFLAPPELRWGMELGAWNATCIKCHTTHGRPRIHGMGEVDSSVAEFGIACEACHGPAEEHVRINRDPLRRYELHRSDGSDSTVVQPARLESRPSAEVCGQCHAVTLFRDAAANTEFREDGFPYRPGDDLLASRLLVRPSAAGDDPERLALRSAHPQYRAEDHFWSDGMIRVSGREYNGLIESPCFAGGDFSCLSCHTMHKTAEDPRSLDEWADDQLSPGMAGDEACLQCHDNHRADLTRHTFHEPASSGSRCYNCHAPYTTYGLLKAIRSHQVSSPTAGESLATGRPNACNQCHLDRTLAWTAEYLERWYGTPQPQLSEEQRAIAASVMWTLEGDAGQRALMAWSFGWEAAREASGSTWMAPYLAQLMLDPYHAVRYIAGRSLRRIEGFGDLEYDHMAGAAELARAHRRVLTTWSSLAGRRTGEALLIESDGSLKQETYSGLLSRRDNHPMILQE